MYNLIEYSDNYSKISGRIWQYCKHIPDVRNNGNIVNFNGNNATNLVNSKAKKKKKKKKKAKIIIT